MDYILTNDTIALLKSNNKTIIYSVDNYKVINKNIKRIINDNCLINGSSINGRLDAAKRILNKSYKLPLKINDNIILLQLNSLRSNDCLFLILNKIISYEYTNSYLKIICVNNNVFYNKISKNSFEKIIANAVRLNNYLNWKK